MTTLDAIFNRRSKHQRGSDLTDNHPSNESDDSTMRKNANHATKNNDSAPAWFINFMTEFRDFRTSLSQLEGEVAKIIKHEERLTEQQKKLDLIYTKLFGKNRDRLCANRVRGGILISEIPAAVELPPRSTMDQVIQAMGVTHMKSLVLGLRGIEALHNAQAYVRNKDGYEVYIKKKLRFRPDQDQQCTTEP
ncbi:hypothetical protein TSAR_006890 [Trichomalopsis sarcophagae]|uniref:Uncharacterized protein n=1 Tax=Trichomalopsis sarcophagae TaxID=543379 RepID=A0A232EX95_9HYME|nr:hypothetical protein TSAR_006890 [Trichomalopsis sarcophagae]